MKVWMAILSKHQKDGVVGITIHCVTILTMLWKNNLVIFIGQFKTIYAIHNKTGGVRIRNARLKQITMKRNFKIRFHLGQGENYMKWRVEDVTTKNVWFFEPENFQALIVNGKLQNHPSTAKKINDGANKTVCAWIMAEDVVLYPTENLWMRGQVSYNPRVMPHWIDNNGNNADKQEFAEMLIDNKKIYTP